MNLKTKIIKISLTSPDKRIIRKIAKEILNGKIIVYPTETCYGLGGNALDRKVVEKIYEIKKKDQLNLIFQL
jgi:L-threonylcarbamoyladenylate synthase